MKKLLSFALLLCALASTAQAQTAAAPADAQAAARELMAAMNVRQMMTAMSQNMQQAMPAMMKAMAAQMLDKKPGMTPQRKAAELAKIERDIPRVANGMAGIFNDAALQDELMKEMAALYARHYTAAELGQITAFYRSPVGAKVLATMPQVMMESMQMSQRVMMPRIIKATETLLQDKAGN